MEKVILWELIEKFKFKPCQIKPSDNEQEKVNLPDSGLCRTGGSQSENQIKRKEKQVFVPSERTKKLWNMKVMVNPIIIGALGTVPKSIVMGLEELKIGGQTKTIQTKMVKIGQNTEKCPGDLRRLAATQTTGRGRPSVNVGVKKTTTNDNNNKNLTRKLEYG